MKSRFDIVVAGAGMVGLLAATLLARSAQAARLNIVVLDAGRPPRFDREQDVGLRVSAISLGSASILDRVGAWDAVKEQRHCPYESMRVWDARAAIESPETLRFDAADFAVPELGFIVENALLRHVLIEQLETLDVDLRFATEIDSLAAERDGHSYRVGLVGGDSLAPDLLVAADGAGSVVRKTAGIPTKAWQYPQSALVTHVTPEFSHRRTAWQRFLKDGPIALLPLADGRVSVVWSTRPEQVNEGLSVSDAELGVLLTDASDAVLGNLRVDGPKGSFPLRAQHAIRYVEPGLALIGDAAHSVHPLAGQGANLGLADASALADAVLDGMERDEYPGDLPTLRAYERARRGANATMLHFIDSINRLFLSDSGGLEGLRRRGMRLFNRSGPIRRRAVQVALGIKV